MKIINKTNSMQSVEFIDGRYVTLRPDEEFEFDESKIYDFELERVKKVFREVIKEIPIAKEIAVEESPPKKKTKNYAFNEEVE